MTRRPSRLLAALVVVLVGAAGCTGVPGSSSPQTVERLNVGALPVQQSIRPTRTDSQRDIVHDFLTANTIEPGKHISARAFLTSAARSRWSDATATILSERTIGTFDPRKGTVTVSGRLLGTLNRDGVFQAGDNAPTSFDFRFVHTSAGYRISQMSPAPGLILRSEDFAQYDRHSLWFFDNQNRHLVEDPRYTDITDQTPLANWLLDRLLDGPRQSLQTALSSDTFPSQVDPAGTSVEVGTTTRIEIPGSSQLDGGGRQRLAAQLSKTLEDATSGNGMTITDGGRPVTIPSLGRAVFLPRDFDEYLPPAPPVPQVYYLSGSDLLTAAGKPVSGPLGRGAYPLTSVALSRPDPTGPMLVAGVEQGTPGPRMVAGTLDGGLRPVDLPGITTRPSFADSRREVWIGAGPRLYRVLLGGDGAVQGAPQAVALSQPPGGSLQAVRVSPDGARVALVFAAKPGAGQLFVAAIVRGSGPVRLGPLDQVNPPGTAVDDVGWLNTLRLFAIGRIASSSDFYAFDAGIDGEGWQSSLVSLAQAPDSVTVTPGAIAAWLSARGFVWEQEGNQWQPPTGGQTPGTAPIYVE